MLNRELNVKAKPLLLVAEPVDTKLIDILGKGVVIPADCSLNGEQLEGIRSSCNTAPGGLMLIQGPPGTGKSYLISWLTVILQEKWIDVQSSAKHQGFIFAPSNTAVDEAMRKCVRVWRGRGMQTKRKLVRFYSEWQARMS
jgi:hypothetical protein